MKWKRSYKIALALFVFLLIELALIRYVDRRLALDVEIYSITPNKWINFLTLITDLGKSSCYLWPFGILTITCSFLARGRDVLPRYRRLFAYVGIRALFLFCTISLSGICADIIKPLVGRARPHLWLANGIYGWAPLTRQGSLWNSMPSGHATTVFTLAFCLSALYPRLRILWFPYAIILAVSRVVVNAHYLSDVLAGAILAWFAVHLFAKYGMDYMKTKVFPIYLAPPLE